MRKARLVYDKLTGWGELRIDVEIEKRSGEVVMKLEARLPGEVKSLHLPLLGINAQAVILGSGARYERDEPRAVDCPTRVASGLYSPQLAVVEGERGVVGLWAETEKYEPANIWLAHAEEDPLVLNTASPYGGRSLCEDAGGLRSPRWR